LVQAQELGAGGADEVRVENPPGKVTAGNPVPVDSVPILTICGTGCASSRTCGHGLLEISFTLKDAAEADQLLIPRHWIVHKQSTSQKPAA
jgi:hypothetical protein